MKKLSFFFLGLLLICGSTINAQNIFDTIIVNEEERITDGIYTIIYKPEDKIEGTEELYYIKTEYKGSRFLIYKDKEVRLISEYQLDWSRDKYMGTIVDAKKITIEYCDENGNVLKELKIKFTGNDNKVNWRVLDGHYDVMYCVYEYRAHGTFDNIVKYLTSDDDNFMRLKVKTYSHGIITMIVPSSPLLTAFINEINN